MIPAPARTITTNHGVAVIWFLTHTEQVRLLLNRIEVLGTLGHLCLLDRWGGRISATGAAYMQRPATHSVVDVVIRMSTTMSRQLDVDHSACLSVFDVGFGMVRTIHQTQDLVSGHAPPLHGAIQRDCVTSWNQLECLRHELLESFGRITWKPFDADVMLLLSKELSEFLALTGEIG